MGLKDIDIKCSIDSSIDDPINDFYVPVLASGNRYDRIAGFFTSSSLAISCKGILELVKKSNGHIRIIACPRLSKEDIDVINGASANPEQYINDSLIKELEDGTNDIVNCYRDLLAHLIAKNIVDIKLVVEKENNKYVSCETSERSGLFHQKVGIVYDENGDFITFSGSMNETFSAWNENIEEFKVFKSWIPTDQKFYISDLDKFESFWNGTRPGIECIDLPSAVKNKFIEIADNSEFSSIKERIQSSQTKKNNIAIFEKLFWYQKEAVDKWEANNRRLLFAMATGTGKTMTALACISKVISEDNDFNKLVIVATPQSSLSLQWKDEFNKQTIDIRNQLVCDSTNNYKSKLQQYITELNIGLVNSVILFSTHATVCKKSFIDVVSQVNHTKVKILFVGDEVHGLGSKEHKSALLVNYEYRIGLSATPARWFDDEGSEVLLQYFGSDKYEFGIDKALTETNPLTNQTFLTPYKYIPEISYLDDDETEKYQYYTEQINRLARIDEKDEETKDKLDRLLEKRADIIKDTKDKLRVLTNLLAQIQREGSIENTLIFVSPHLLNPVMKILNRFNISSHPLTQNESAKPASEYAGLSERQYIIKCFRDKTLKIIVAIKCMDEGIDIPSADTAILVSSTTNPREYIQRIGRVIRRYPGKQYAYIYDFVVECNDPEINATIYKNELRRIRYIAEMSSNPMDTIDVIF